MVESQSRARPYKGKCDADPIRLAIATVRVLTLAVCSHDLCGLDFTWTDR